MSFLTEMLKLDALQGAGNAFNLLENITDEIVKRGEKPEDYFPQLLSLEVILELINKDEPRSATDLIRLRSKNKTSKTGVLSAEEFKQFQKEMEAKLGMPLLLYIAQNNLTEVYQEFYTKIRSDIQYKLSYDAATFRNILSSLVESKNTVFLYKLLLGKNHDDVALNTGFLYKLLHWSNQDDVAFVEMKIGKPWLAWLVDNNLLNKMEPQFLSWLISNKKIKLEDFETYTGKNFQDWLVESDFGHFKHNTIVLDYLGKLNDEEMPRLQGMAFNQGKNEALKFLNQIRKYDNNPYITSKSIANALLHNPVGAKIIFEHMPKINLQEIEGEVNEDLFSLIFKNESLNSLLGLPVCKNYFAEKLKQPGYNNKLRLLIVEAAMENREGFLSKILPMLSQNKVNLKTLLTPQDVVKILQHKNFTIIRELISHGINLDSAYLEKGGLKGGIVNWLRHNVGEDPQGMLLESAIIEQHNRDYGRYYLTQSPSGDFKITFQNLDKKWLDLQPANAYFNEVISSFESSDSLGKKLNITVEEAKAKNLDLASLQARLLPKSIAEGSLWKLMEDYHALQKTEEQNLLPRIRLLQQIRDICKKLALDPLLTSGQKQTLEDIATISQNKALYLSDLKKIKSKSVKMGFRQTHVKGYPLVRSVADKEIPRLYKIDPFQRSFPVSLQETWKILVQKGTPIKNFWLWLEGQDTSTLIGQELRPNLTYLNKVKMKEGLCYAPLSMTNSESLLNGRFIYNIDPRGNLFIGHGMHMHPFILGSAELLSAGFVIFKNGKITAIDSSSGHYQPKTYNLRGALEVGQFLEKGVFAEDASISLYAYPVTTPAQFLDPNFDPISHYKQYPPELESTLANARSRPHPLRPAYGRNTAELTQNPTDNEISTAFKAFSEMENAVRTYDPSSAAQFIKDIPLIPAEYYYRLLKELVDGMKQEKNGGQQDNIRKLLNTVKRFNFKDIDNYLGFSLIQWIAQNKPRYLHLYDSEFSKYLKANHFQEIILSGNKIHMDLVFKLINSDEDLLNLTLSEDFLETLVKTEKQDLLIHLLSQPFINFQKLDKNFKGGIAKFMEDNHADYLWKNDKLASFLESKGIEKRNFGLR